MPDVGGQALAVRVDPARFVSADGCLEGVHRAGIAKDAGRLRPYEYGRPSPCEKGGRPFTGLGAGVGSS